ncbi:MAG: DUF4831 family protein [Mediterranea sp.]|jgi:hypothetical protein|nr:DUF4831 family protein [Mediterranea sp.]
MKKNHLLTLLAALLSLPVAAQTEVLTGIMRGKDFGVTYILPKTEIVLTVSATKHTRTPGEFAKYANRYLRLNDATMEKEVHWTLDRMQTEVIGVPDKDNVYFVKMKDKTVAPLMELTKDGIVCSINMPLGTTPKSAETLAGGSVPTDPLPDPRNFLTEEILMASSTAKMAELVAKEIYSIRESKNNLLRGEAETMPQDGVQLKLMLDNLNRQETALTEMFSGKEVTEQVVRTLHIVPEAMTEHVVFRFSQKLGILDGNDLAGEPVYLTLTDLKSVNIPPADGKKTVEGIAYNVPGRANITLNYRNEELLNAEVPVTQFGTIEYLAPVLFNKNSTTKVLFNPVTGGLVKVDRNNN